MANEYRIEDGVIYDAAGNVIDPPGALDWFSWDQRILLHEMQHWHELPIPEGHFFPPVIT